MDEEYLKECLIRLMKHPIASKPISELGDDLEGAIDLVNALAAFDEKGEYLLEDYIQQARLAFCLAELDRANAEECMATVENYHEAFCALQKGGFDLSFKKWLELFSLRKKMYF